MTKQVGTEINNAIQSFTSVFYTTSEQHKDNTKLRQERDMEDTSKVIAYLQHISPLTADKC